MTMTVTGSEPAAPHFLRSAGPAWTTRWATAQVAAPPTRLMSHPPRKRFKRKNPTRFLRGHASESWPMAEELQDVQPRSRRGCRTSLSGFLVNICLRNLWETPSSPAEAAGT